MKSLVYLAMLLSISCTTTSGSNSKNPVNDYKIVSHAEQFVSFWDAAKGMEKADRLKLFESSPFNTDHQEFYDDIAFGSKMDPNWKQNKIESLEEIFDQYEKKQQKILTQHQFLKEKADVWVKAAFRRYKFDRPIEIVITPVLTSGGTLRVRDKVILAIGSNVLADFKDADFIIPHELTHAYHNSVSNFPGGDDLALLNSDEAKLYWGLWTEGMATYGVYEVTKIENMKFIMGHKEYSSINFHKEPRIDAKLADLFLKVMDDRYINLDDSNVRRQTKNWFGVKSNVMGNETPSAPGYYLGFRVIQTLITSGKFTFDDLLRLNRQEVRPHIIDALKTFKAASDAQEKTKNSSSAL
ncbi:MAG TPA: hypothetical protein VE954_22095 [Oligoflexus sp.]|uniref:hypothetical protein n=1 Tax=Oligoflexus sp. TaxID=1971216 RepID=UPI002D54D51F|nr:hypothetical protein [Oligoflexus sp.]HYX35799.1 hypothetical protein [Oligoflexus sp.]